MSAPSSPKPGSAITSPSPLPKPTSPASWTTRSSGSTEIWQAALDARADGVDVVAVTVWALLGSFNWCHLVTRDTGAYEPGVFDLSNPTRTPQPTNLAAFARQLTNGHPIPSPAKRGWWSHPDRLTFPPVVAKDSTAKQL